jgi:hypothetical protein
LYSLPPDKYHDYFNSGYERFLPVPLQFIVNLHPVLLYCIVTGRKKEELGVKQSRVMRNKDLNWFLIAEN